MELKNGKYIVDDIPVLDLVKQYGTPLFIYETSRMRFQYERLAQAFGKTRAKIYYACKALTNLNVLQYFRSLGSGLDTVSIQEVMLGLKAGFNPADILFTPNCVSMEEINEASDLGVRINIDNISILEQFGNRYGSSIPVSVRINPHIMVGANSKISTGHIDSKFGISIHQLPLLQRVTAANNMTVEGLHMHTGSDILDIDVFIRGVDILLETAARFPDLKFIDIGSGFKVPYRNDDVFTDEISHFKPRFLV